MKQTQKDALIVALEAAHREVESARQLLQQAGFISTSMSFGAFQQDEISGTLRKLHETAVEV